MTLDDDKDFRADAADYSRQEQSHKRPAQGGELRRCRLSGGRPGPRRGSDLRAPGDGAVEAVEVRGAGSQRASLEERRTPSPSPKTKEKKKAEPKKEIPPTDPKKIFRVTFNEITPKAIRAAFDHPRQVDTNLVDAQQARRVLDRIVGYKISPLLWDKVRRGLSAGRVQTVALRLIVEREQEIRAFVPQEYWSIHAMLDAGEPPIVRSQAFKYKGEDIEINNQEGADAVLAAVNKAKWQVASVTQKEKSRNPPPPFTTSKLQQAAYNRLRYTAKRTMGWRSVCMKAWSLARKVPSR